LDRELEKYYKKYAKKPQRVQKTVELSGSDDSESLYSSDNISDESPKINKKKNKEYDNLAKELKHLQKKMQAYEK